MIWSEIWSVIFRSCKFSAPALPHHICWDNVRDDDHHKALLSCGVLFRFLETPTTNVPT